MGLEVNQSSIDRMRAKMTKVIAKISKNTGLDPKTVAEVLWQYELAFRPKGKSK